MEMGHSRESMLCKQYTDQNLTCNSTGKKKKQKEKSRDIAYSTRTKLVLFYR